jgi:hypothetical protein
LSAAAKIMSDLPPAPELAVIINVQTKYVSTLALLSTLRHLRIPTVMIDCESQDGSFEWFGSLQRDFSFHLVREPRRRHGAALDRIFQSTQAERILLVDSDIEVLNNQMFELMRGCLCDEQTYGAGYLQPGAWLETHYGTDQPLSPGIGFYKSRPWIPFALLRVRPVRAALSAGASFMHRLELNDVPQIPALSHLLWRRFAFSPCRRMRLRGLDLFRREYEGRKPSYLFFDTGAEIHEMLSQMKYSFGDVGPAIPYWSIRHLQGVTRDLLQGPARDARSARTAESDVLKKLKEYGVGA